MHNPKTKQQGETHSSARLKPADVIAIRAAYIPAEYGVHRLAKQYGVSPVAVWKIVNRKSWKHV